MKSTVNLMNEEELLKIMGDKSPVGVCVIQDGKFCYVNSNFPFAIGYTVDELLDKDPMELIVPEDRELVKESAKRMLKGELISPYQFRVLHKDGSVRWIMARIISIQYQGRRAVLGNYMEVTERKQMEEALKVNEEKYKELADSISDIFFAMDEHLRYTYWNKASEILTGIRAEDAIGKSLLEIFPDKPWRRRAEKVYRSVLKTQQPQTFVNDYDIDGRRYVFEITAYPSSGGISVFVNDITEHKQMEEKLKESEQKYRTILEEMGDGYFETDLAGNLTYVNDALIRLLGYSQEELIGMNFRALRPKEEAKAVFEAYNHIYKTGEPLRNLFTEIICKDGRHVFAETSAFPIRNNKGEIIGFRGIRRDITERKQAEEKLKESEQKYRLLFETSPDCIVQIDREGRYLTANPATARSLGIPLGELIGKTVFEVMPQEVAQLRFENMRKVFDEWQPRIFEDERARRYFYHIVIPLKTSDHKEAVQVITRDITERKLAEEKLRQSEENYRALFDSSVIGTIVLDAETMKVVMANQAAAKMFEFSSAEEGIGLNPLDFVLPEDRERVLEVISKDLFEQDLRRTNEFRAITKDGREIWISVTAARIMHGGKLAGLISFTDITERKQMEEALRRSEERYRTILEEMEDSYFEVDLGGHLTFVNNSVCRDLGYSRKELIGMSYKVFTVEKDIESVFRVFNEVYRTGVPNKGFPWKTIRKDGICGFAETSISLLRNNKGEIIGFRGVGRDVTERKQAEEKLQQSEENYKTLFNNSVIGMYVLDAETFKVVMGNRAAAEMAGFSSVGEGLGINPLDFVIPEDREQILGMAVKEFEQDLRQTHEVRVIGKDGGIGWISITSARIMHKGRPASLVSFINITERKKMEEALRQSEENYRALFDSSVIGTFVLDAETMKVVMGNEAAMKLAGLDSPSEGIGMNAFAFVMPEDRGRILEIVNKELFEQDLRRIHEFRAITKDGRKIWISITGARIMHKGKLAGLISFTDITERKQTEEALRQSEENYRALFDSSVIGTVVLDAETMKVVMVNQAALRMFGFSSAEEAFEAEPFNFILQEDKEKYLDITRTVVFEQNSHEGYQLRALTRDGREIWINTTATKIMHKGRVAALISFTDITEQKKQNERLMMTDRLASLGELASGTAHELNNPLTSIIGFSQLLMEKEVPDDIREDLKLMNSEAQRAVSVTQNLLTFARKHASVKQRNQINSIIEDVLKLRAYEHKANSIEVERHLAPDLPEIMVDYFQMQQVFMNIVINAEYFMIKAHGKGTLTITTEKQNDMIMISIADDGPGIPPENLKRIFDPFFTTKEAGKGTGLGLSICHGIVTEHGGQIRVKSKLGKGATFFIELPIKGHSHIEGMFKID